MRGSVGEIQGTLCPYFGPVQATVHKPRQLGPDGRRLSLASHAPAQSLLLAVATLAAAQGRSASRCFVSGSVSDS